MNGGERSSVEALTVARKIRKEYAKSTHAPPRPDQGLYSLKRASLQAYNRGFCLGPESKCVIMNREATDSVRVVTARNQLLAQLYVPLEGSSEQRARSLNQESR